VDYVCSLFGTSAQTCGLEMGSELVPLLRACSNNHPPRCPQAVVAMNVSMKLAGFPGLQERRSADGRAADRLVTARGDPYWYVRARKTRALSWKHSGGPTCFGQTRRVFRGAGTEGAHKLEPIF